MAMALPVSVRSRPDAGAKPTARSAATGPSALAHGVASAHEPEPVVTLRSVLHFLERIKNPGRRSPTDQRSHAYGREASPHEARSDTVDDDIDDIDDFEDELPPEDLGVDEDVRA